MFERSFFLTDSVIIAICPVLTSEIWRPGLLQGRIRSDSVGFAALKFPAFSRLNPPRPRSRPRPRPRIPRQNHPPFRSSDFSSFISLDFSKLSGLFDNFTPASPAIFSFWLALWTDAQPERVSNEADIWQHAAKANPCSPSSIHYHLSFYQLFCCQRTKTPSYYLSAPDSCMFPGNIK